VTTHVEKAVVEGIETEIGRDPRHMAVVELNALGHEGQPLLQVIRANCKECAGYSEAEVRRCRLVKCLFWPYRMGSNPFRTREMSDEQRIATAERLRIAREKMGRNGSGEPPANAVKLNGATIYVSPKQREAVELVLKTPSQWDTLHGKTRGFLISAGWIEVDGGGTPALTEAGKTIASTLGIN
jgi:hypothetical protein